MVGGVGMVEFARVVGRWAALCVLIALLALAGAAIVSLGVERHLISATGLAPEPSAPARRD